MPFQRVSALFEMQTASSRIWIWDTDSISYDDCRDANRMMVHVHSSVANSSECSKLEELFTLFFSFYNKFSNGFKTDKYVDPGNVYIIKVTWRGQGKEDKGDLLKV